MTFTVIPFVVGLGGLIGIWLFRSWEVKRGRRMWEDRRRLLDTTVAEAYRAIVAGDALRTHRARIFALAHSLSHRALTALVLILRTIERPLARISYRMRAAPPKIPAREPSEFLKTLMPEKKNSEGVETPNTL